MSHIAWYNPKKSVKRTRSEMLRDVKKIECLGKFVSKNTPYQQVIALVAAMVGRINVTLVDPSLTCLHSFDDNQPTTNEFPVSADLDNWNQLVDELRAAADSQWRLGLYTSGSTGKPKHVWQNARSLTRRTKTSPTYRDHRWGLCYKPSHMAGIQVVLQALLNGNPIVYLFDSQPDLIGRTIQEQKLSHISATPTYYRLRMTRLGGAYPSVRRITSGGEPFDSRTMEQLREVFPNAEVRNIYALTETGALLESDSESFEIPESLSSSLRISNDGELLISKSIIKGEKHDKKNVEDKWIHTGDIVEKKDDGSIKFIGRNSDKVTVAGYQVHLREVEQEILSSDDRVVEAVVKARDSSVTGNILVAYLSTTSDSNQSSVAEKLRSTLSRKLVSYKVPRKYYFKNNINLSRTGKKVRE